MAKFSKKKRAILKKKPDANPELKGFDIKVNTFGEIHSNYDIDTINKFLDKNLRDKKAGGKIRKKES